MNLGRREDRRVRCEEEFARHKLPVRRFPAVDARYLRRSRGFETLGRYAHTFTTRLIIRQAAKEKVSAVFIFEDDVVLRFNFAQILDQIELPPDWGMFYLGCQHQERPEVVSEGLVRVKGALDTHAWGVRDTHFARVAKALSRKERAEDAVHPATDVVLARLQSEIPTYGTFPNLAWQAEEHSDLVDGAYSAYWSDGTQKWAKHVVAGTVAEALGGRAYAPAVEEALRHRSWFRNRALPAGTNTAPPSVSPNATRPPASFGVVPTSLQQGRRFTIAFLFLTRGDVNHPRIWEEYLAPRGNCVRTYGHAAHPEAITTEWLTKGQVRLRYETAWGDISLVRAQLSLLRQALNDSDNEFFVFCSESCVPIRPLWELQRLLEFDRRSRFYFERWTTTETRHPAKADRALQLRRIPHTLCHYHSQWVLLNRQVATLLVEDDFTPHFENVASPDECYFGTVLAMKGFPMATQIAPFDVTWASWPGLGAAHPQSFENVPAELAGQLAVTGCFFARKLLPHSNIGAYGLHLSPGAE